MLSHAHRWVTSDGHSLEVNFSVVMSSPGSPRMVNERTLNQNVVQQDDSCFVIFGAKIKIAPTGVRSRVWESLAKWLI